MPGCFVFEVPVGIEKGRGFKIVSCLQATDVITILKRQPDGNAVTQGEANILLQLIEGQSLKQIAAKDEVSYETRRYQFKQIQSKFALGKNTDLMTFVITQIHRYLFAQIYQRLSSLAQTQHEREDIAFFQQCYGPRLRACRKIFIGWGRITVFELGPVEGRPVLVFHSTALPIFPLVKDVGILYDNNIRIICPTRPGFCGTELDLDANDPVIHFCGALEQYLVEQKMSQLYVLAFRHGIGTAVEFLSNTNLSVTKAVFAVSELPSHISGTNSSIRPVSFTLGLLKLGNKNLDTIKSALRLAGTVLTSHDRLIAGVKRLYKNCPIDSVDALTEYGDPASHWIPRVGKWSIDGIALDIQHKPTSWVDQLPQLKVPLVLVQGDHDPHKTFSQLDELAGLWPFVSVKKIANAGILYTYVRPRVLLGLLLEEKNHQ